MGPHPDDGVEGGFLVAVDRLVPGEEVGVLEQLASVPTQALDVLKHGDSEDIDDDNDSDQWWYDSEDDGDDSDSDDDRPSDEGVIKL